MSRRVAPPSGSPVPTSVELAGHDIALAPLAQSVAERYFHEFPQDLERYGDAARAWEIHDTTHCLHWAVLDVDGFADLHREATWLAHVLAARGFPLEHLARNLELAADVIDEQLSETGQPVAARLRSAATTVREGAH
jgi:hypothetical protein